MRPPMGGHMSMEAVLTSSAALHPGMRGMHRRQAWHPSPSRVVT